MILLLNGAFGIGKTTHAAESFALHVDARREVDQIAREILANVAPD